MVTMRRFAIKGYGEAQDVFEEIDAHPREVGSGHVRVEIKAFSVNPYDVALRLGEMKEIRTLKFPYVPGNDGAGIVTEIGSDVTTVHVGDRVAVHAVGGTYGEEVVLPSAKVAKIPDKMSWEEAAGMVTPGITAYNLINHLTEIQPTDTVMILGASGAVGSSLIQLLHEKGIRILTSASSKNEEKVKKLGASAFAAYDKTNPGLQFADQADLVIDATKGSIKGETGIQIMKPGGRYVALNDLPDLDLRQKKEGFYESFVPRKEYLDAEAFAGIIKAYQKGAFHVFISMNLSASLKHVIHAHQLVEGHPPAGKIILSFEK